MLFEQTLIHIEFDATPFMINLQMIWKRLTLKHGCYWSYNNNNNNNNNSNNNNNNGITQTAFPHSGSSSTWGTNGFTSLSKDGAAKEGHLNIQLHGQAGNRTRDLLASSLRSYQLSQYRTQ